MVGDEILGSRKYGHGNEGLVGGIEGGSEEGDRWGRRVVENGIHERGRYSMVVRFLRAASAKKA